MAPREVVQAACASTTRSWALDINVSLCSDLLLSDMDNLGNGSIRDGNLLPRRFWQEADSRP